MHLLFTHAFYLNTYKIKSPHPQSGCLKRLQGNFKGFKLFLLCTTNQNSIPRYIGWGLIFLPSHILFRRLYDGKNIFLFVKIKENMKNVGFLDISLDASSSIQNYFSVWKKDGKLVAQARIPENAQISSFFVSLTLNRLGGGVGRPPL